MANQLPTGDAGVKASVISALCTRCKKNPQVPYGEQNYWCLQCNYQYANALRLKRKADKLCVDCGKGPLALDTRGNKTFKSRTTTRCESCLLRNHIASQANFLENKTRAMAMFNNKCAHCGLENAHSAVYQFHHIDPLTKSFGISSKIKKGWRVLEPELKKCIMVCANCHITLEAKLKEEKSKRHGRMSTAIN